MVDKVFLQVFFVLEVVVECEFDDLDLDYGDFVEVGYVFDDFLSEVVFIQFDDMSLLFFFESIDFFLE